MAAFFYLTTYLSMFHFKQFSVNDDCSSMKVGTDAVLLGTCVDSPVYDTPQRVLEIGTGCGVISLIIAQRFEHAEIDAIDIDTDSIKQAQKNFEESPWASRLHTQHGAIQTYNAPKYNLIVSNPPFFENSLKAPNKQRNLARHTDSLSIEALIENVDRLLEREGSFWGILPYLGAQKAIQIASKYSLVCNKLLLIRNTENSIVKRAIFKLSYSGDCTTEQHYAIRNLDNTYSEWYRQLTTAFYTHLK